MYFRQHVFIFSSTCTQTFNVLIKMSHVCNKMNNYFATCLHIFVYMYENIRLVTQKECIFDNMCLSFRLHVRKHSMFQQKWNMFVRKRINISQHVFIFSTKSRKAFDVLGKMEHVCLKANKYFTTCLHLFNQKQESIRCFSKDVTCLLESE